jgi:hypothetical protein
MWLTGGSSSVGVGIQDLYAMRRVGSTRSKTYSRAHAQEQLRDGHRLIRLEGHQQQGRVSEMSITLDVVIKDTLHRILNAAEEEDLKKLAEITDLRINTLKAIRDYIDKELDTFYNEFLKEEDNEE